MNPIAVLALLGSLYEQLSAAQAEVARLTAEVARLTADHENPTTKEGA